MNVATLRGAAKQALEAMQYTDSVLLHREKHFDGDKGMERARELLRAAITRLDHEIRASSGESWPV